MLKSVNLLPRSACSKTIMNMKFEQMSRLIKYERISVSPSVCLAAQDVLAAGDHWVKPLRTRVQLVRSSGKEQNRKYSRQQDRQPVGELVACE